MIDLVLERLELLQAQLAAIDPAGELRAADEVAALAVALRDLMVAADDAAVSTPPADLQVRRGVLREIG